MRPARFAVSLAAAVALLVAAPSSLAVEPPNPNDPCSSGGRNTCGTNGVGFHDTYRYGLRWFGDFRGAVSGEAQTFCIDLGYWYPAPRYRFREAPAGPLRNRLNRTVPLVNQQKMAYAIWRYGRSSNPRQQAATMLYVHSLMGDARPGEIDPGALGSDVASLFERISSDATRYHGPYRLDLDAPARLTVGERGSATIRLRTRSGTAVPDIAISLGGDGLSGLPARVQTDDQGVARVSFTAGGGSARLSARAILASNLPKIYVPTLRAAARNGQRLVAPDAQTVTESASIRVGKAELTVSTAATPNRVVVGQPSTDRITIRGAQESFNPQVTVQIHGPAPTEAEIRCDGTPAFATTMRTKGSGTFTSPPARLDKVGWYSYVEIIPGDAGHIGLTTPCRARGETFRVEAQPRVQTVVSSQRVEPGSTIYDTVNVSGLAGQTVTVQAALYGPLPSREGIVCTGTPIWTGSFEAATDGEYRTADVKLDVPGYYTYVERIAAGGFVRAVDTRCGETTETTIVAGKPQLRTVVSAQRTAPGATITDKVEVTGLGRLDATVRASLWGPFPTRAAITCEGRPYWSGTFVAKGDGSYDTAPVKLDRAGYYTYQEAIVESPAFAAVTTACGEAAETSLARAAPTVSTVVSHEVVAPGFEIFDRIRVRGLGATEATIQVELFGPFATREAMSCGGRPYWQGRVVAKGDGTLRSPSVRLAKAGFYTYREKIAGSDTVAAHTTECGQAIETVLARPEIHTGRGEVTRFARGTQETGSRPTRVEIPSLGIGAPVLPARIDLARGILAAPDNIARTGWWQDGMAPGARIGSVLIAGHVDSARAGPGAFFRLNQARSGTIVRVRAQNGRTYSYRVTSVRTYLKRNLPTGIYSRQGRHRLVLVTCGGPFDEGDGSYRDNIVVTAVPVSS